MENIIRLRSRYGIKNYLKRLFEPYGSKSKTYVLETDIPTVRVGEGNMFIDPTGGPMIMVGHKLEEAKMVVKSIDFVKDCGYTITFE